MNRTLGVCYYPEQWPKSQWRADAQRMQELGLTWVRIGEFAWSRLEPHPDQFDFDWLDEAISTLADRGLKVVLGTPTATPPRWLLDRHPDLLAVTADGQPRKFGSRRHYCFSHVGYRNECARIVTLLAERYGQHPGIHAWQTDNEYGCHDTVLSYSKSARVAFQQWLAHRYNRIEALNNAWGNVFWSMDYQDFNQIDCPNATVTTPNPAHVLDFRRFSSDQVVSFNRLQVEILRRYTDKPIAHNYMGRVTEFDHFAVGADLDIASWDSYPIGFLSDRLDCDNAHKTEFLRQGDPDFQAFHHDLYRAVGRGRWWVMEQQPGPVNWAPYNPAPLPGMVRLWTWEAFAHGAEAVCYFRWRQAPFAQEQMHSGLLRIDDKPAPGFAEAAQVAQEIAQAPAAETTPAEVALVFDYTSEWAWQAQPQGAQFNYFNLVLCWYRVLRQLGLNIDIIPPDTADLSPWKLVCLPGLFHINPTLMTALSTFQGQAIVGPRTHSKTEHFAIPNPLPPNLPGLDVQVSRVESLPPAIRLELECGGSVQHWREHLEGQAQVALRLSDGSPVIQYSEHLSYIGGWLDDDTLKDFVGRRCEAIGIAVMQLPMGLRKRDSGQLRFWFNHSSQPIDWEGRYIPAAGVLWESINT